MTVNRHFADALVKFVEEGDAVWIHDYQLIPLGALLRERGVKVMVQLSLRPVI